ncbi:MAG TPA: hypothetical protein PLQ00_04380, partial [Thermoguttaceae bacterium]|nr:hypothetical protein [Thermoguttaceae bacterium]
MSGQKENLLLRIVPSKNTNERLEEVFDTTIDFTKTYDYPLPKIHTQNLENMLRRFPLKDFILPPKRIVGISPFQMEHQAQDMEKLGKLLRHPTPSQHSQSSRFKIQGRFVALGQNPRPVKDHEKEGIASQKEIALDIGNLFLLQARAEPPPIAAPKGPPWPG